MKIHAIVLAFGGLVGVVAAAQAQDVKLPGGQVSELPPGPLEHLQDVAGKVTADVFNTYNPLIDSPEAKAPDSPEQAAGQALRSGLQFSGSIFAAPYAAIDPGANAAPAAKPAPAPRYHRHARLHRRVHPATAG